MNASDLHRHHVAHDVTGEGWRIDVGDGSWRYEGPAAGPTKKAMALRLAVCWNICEGIPTAALESGVIREFYTAARELAEALEKGIEAEELTAEQLRPLIEKLRDADKRHAITGVDCNCSEHSPSDPPPKVSCEAPKDGRRQPCTHTPKHKRLTIPDTTEAA